MENILKEILTRLKTQVPELKTIAIDDGQLDNTDEAGNYPLILPAALIDIDAVTWTTTTDPEQSGEGVIIIRFAWQTPARFDNLESATMLAGGLARWNLHHKIAKALHGFSGTNFGRLERLRTQKDKREGVVKIMEIQFSFEGGEVLTPPVED